MLPAHLARMALFAVNTGPTRQQRMRLAVAVGSSSARGRKRRLCGSTGGIQDQATARCGSQRRRLVDHRNATREASDLGLPLSRQAHRNHEQQWLAGGAARSGLTARSRPRSSPFVCVPFASGTRFGRRSRSSARRCPSFDGRSSRTADVGRLLKQANLVLNRSGTQSVLRVADGHRSAKFGAPGRIRTHDPLVRRGQN